MRKFTIDGYKAGKPVYTDGSLRKVTIRKILENCSDNHPIVADIEGIGTRCFSIDGISHSHPNYKLVLGENGPKKYLLRFLYIILLAVFGITLFPDIVLILLAEVISWPFKFIVTGDKSFKHPFRFLDRINNLINEYFFV